MKVFSTLYRKLIIKWTCNISTRKAVSLSKYNFFHNKSMAICETISSSVVKDLTPPCQVRGMTVLNRDKFHTPIEVPYIVIPAEKMKMAFKILKPYLLKMRNLNPVIVEKDGSRRILIHPLKLQDFTISKDKLQDMCQIIINWTNVDVKYDNWSSEDIFKAVLPKDSVGNVSSFSIIGHIIHLNLKPELLDYKYLIGQVLLDKYSNIKTVVNKCETIDNEFRNFKMEHLAGECNYQVLVKENGFQYAFDFEKVFWNPRLSREHSDMTKKFNSTDIVFDVFAGVGPFAVPMAKKGCLVHANDLNPDSYHWLCHNAKLNKVQDRIKTYNMDGNDFIQIVIKQELLMHFNAKEENKGLVHILMNLPALALTFLKSFKGLLNGQPLNNSNCMPVVHCYFFKRKDEEVTDVLKNFLKKNLLATAEISTVRVVAPNKIMMLVSFKLSKTVLCDDEDIESEPSAKRLKVSTEN